VAVAATAEVAGEVAAEVEVVAAMAATDAAEDKTNTKGAMETTRNRGNPIGTQAITSGNAKVIPERIRAISKRRF
jgi:hypothetical protein